MDDELVRLLAGYMGVAAVLVNVLIDKGIVRRDELIARFKQALDAAAASSANPEASLMLGEMILYLEPEEAELSDATH